MDDDVVLRGASTNMTYAPVKDARSRRTPADLPTAVKRALLAGSSRSLSRSGRRRGGRPGSRSSPRRSTPSPRLPGSTPPGTALPNVSGLDPGPPLVSVGIDRQGDVVLGRGDQRLVLTRTGITAAAPAPVRDVVAATGSESSPGLREDAVLWSGFSSGDKVPRRPPLSIPSLRLRSSRSTVDTQRFGSPAERDGDHGDDLHSARRSGSARQNPGRAQDRPSGTTAGPRNLREGHR